MSEGVEDAPRAYRRRSDVVAPLDPLPVHGGSGVVADVDLGDAAALGDVRDEDTPVGAFPTAEPPDADDP